MRLPRRHDHIFTFLFGFCLIFAEHVWIQQGNYVLPKEFGLISSIAVFGGMALGSLIVLFLDSDVLEFAELNMIAGACLYISALGFFLAPDFTFFFLFFGFTGFGALFTKIFEWVPLKRIVIYFGLGTLAFYGVLFPLYSFFGRGVVALSLVPPILLGTFLTRPIRRSILGVALLVAIVVSHLAGIFSFQSSFLRLGKEGMREASQIMPTMFSPLLLTDLYWSPWRKGSIIVTNGHAFAQVVNKRDLDEARAGQKYQMIYDAPYYLRSAKTVLIVGAAGGRNVLAALSHGAEKVYAIDINPAVFELMQGVLSSETGHLYSDPRVIPMVQEGRNFLETTAMKFDLIVVQGTHTETRGRPTTAPLLESFLFTSEALSRMWKLLNPSGMIFLEDYRGEIAGSQVSLLQNVASLAHENLNLVSDRQVIYFLHDQGKRNLNGSSPRVREGLILSKTDLPEVDMTAPFFSGMNVRKGTILASLPRNAAITDERPFFGRIIRGGHWHFVVLSIVILAASSLIISAKKSSGWNERIQNQSFFLMGIGYILFLLALQGPCVLLLGSPQISGPFVLATLLFSSVLGGLFSLRFPKINGGVALGILGVLIVSMPSALSLLKPWMLSQESTALRCLAIFIPVGIVAVCAEIPYIAGLQNALSGSRTRAFACGKAGVASGILLGIPLNSIFGFSWTFFASAAFYVLSAILMQVEFLRRQSSKS